MSDATELPIFPTTAPDVFRDPDATSALFGDVLSRLADVVDLHDNELGLPTPCDGYDAGRLQAHVLGWLDFFAAALGDPAATLQRPDPGTFELADSELASDVVRRCLTEFRQAITDGIARQIVTMSSSRMAGDGVLGMALGEYIVHAWDLARATGRPYDIPDSAVAPAHMFLQGMVVPDYRGPASGFFDEEIPVPSAAPPLDRLLGFAGRDPGWPPLA